MICFLLRCVMPLLVALPLSFYHGLPKTPQLCLLISLTLTRRFVCLRPGSSVTFSLWAWFCRDVSEPVQMVQCAFVLYIHELKGCASALKIKTINQFHRCEPKLACPCGYAVCAYSFCIIAVCRITHVCLSPIEERHLLHHSERPRYGSPEFQSTCISTLVNTSLAFIFGYARTS